MSSPLVNIGDKEICLDDWVRVHFTLPLRWERFDMTAFPCFIPGDFFSVKCQLFDGDVVGKTLEK